MSSMALRSLFIWDGKEQISNAQMEEGLQRLGGRDRKGWVSERSGSYKPVKGLFSWLSSESGRGDWTPPFYLRLQSSPSQMKLLLPFSRASNPRKWQESEFAAAGIEKSHSGLKWRTNVKINTTQRNSLEFRDRSPGTYFGFNQARWEGHLALCSFHFHSGWETNLRRRGSVIHTLALCFVHTRGRETT